MDPIKRIQLGKLTAAELPPDADTQNAAELRREAEINSALSGMRIPAGIEPGRERMLAAAREQSTSNRENRMNPIVKLMSGRPWPARLAIAGGLLLGVTVAAQLPAGPSYANSAGQAIVFDLGVAASADEEAAKREQWELQSQGILDRFRAIRESAHHVAVMSSFSDDNLRSLSGVIFVMDEDSAEAQSARKRAAERFSAYTDEDSIRGRMQELREEIELLAGGADQQSREELARAKNELARARQMLEGVMGERASRLDEASAAIEAQLELLEGQGPDSENVKQLKVKLEKIRAEEAQRGATDADRERMLKEIREVQLDDHRAELDLAREEMERARKEMGEERDRLQELDIQALVEKELKQAGIELDNALIELQDGQLELELEEALKGLDSLDSIREVAITELRDQELQLRELHEGLQLELLQELDGDQLVLELQLSQLENEAFQQDLHVNLEELGRELELELKGLEDLKLEEVKLELQKIDELKGVLTELQLPDGELLELTMLREADLETERGAKLSFRFEDHLFSFPVNTPAKKMAATVNKWLKQNGYDCQVRVEVTTDDEGRPCAAKAVVK
ncbi:MAG: hypothetical protein H7A35_08645 [Planctomycetales bacterium]|nr:hypothetical protein [bacterium]UNM06951.1 MAG: hypothetical protein H7A35_08645 [Planctomycetales bacterium]